MIANRHPRCLPFRYPNRNYEKRVSISQENSSLPLLHNRPLSQVDDLPAHSHLPRRQHKRRVQEPNINLKARSDSEVHPAVHIPQFLPVQPEKDSLVSSEWLEEWGLDVCDDLNLLLEEPVAINAELHEKRVEHLYLQWIGNYVDEPLGSKSQTVKRMLSQRGIHSSSTIQQANASLSQQAICQSFNVEASRSARMQSQLRYQQRMGTYTDQHQPNGTYLHSQQSYLQSSHLDRDPAARYTTSRCNTHLVSALESLAPSSQKSRLQHALHYNLQQPVQSRHLPLDYMHIWPCHRFCSPAWAYPCVSKTVSQQRPFATEVAHSALIPTPHAIYYSQVDSIPGPTEYYQLPIGNSLGAAH